MIPQPRLHRMSKDEKRQVKAKLKTEREERKELRMKFKKEEKRKKLEESLRLLKIERKQDRLKSAGHSSGPFCSCKVCLEGVDMTDWYRRRNAYKESQPWPGTSNEEIVVSVTSCEVCGVKVDS